MKKTVLFLLLLLYTFTLSAQYYRPENRVWIMGARTGLNFNGPGNPVAIPSQMQGSNDEGCASVSDEGGNLLFYSNGYKAWTANHTVMPHGQNINGFANIVSSASQGTLIVPFPQGTRRFYLFTLLQYTAYKCQLYCNVVDMSLNGGLGDIDTTFSLYGTVLADSLAEKIIAVQGCNNNIWVLVHHTNDPVFKAFDITPTGINTTPVISTQPSSPASWNPYFFGVMKASPNRDKIILGRDLYLMLYQFDPANGIVYNPQILDNNGYGYYGMAFSPNGSKVYAKSSGYTDTLYQFDLNVANPIASKAYVGIARHGWMDMKLATDGKIYMGSPKGVTAWSLLHYMARVNYPDSAGAACSFQDSVTSTYFYNPADTMASLMIGLPNDVVFPAYFGSDSSRLAMDTTICHFPAGGLHLHADTTFAQRTWSNGDTTATLAIQQEGTYRVTYSTRQCYTRTDTFRVKGNMIAAQIVYANNLLGTTQTYATYQWYKAGAMIAGATGQYYAPSGTGWYSVKVSNADGCTDSTAYEITSQTGIIDPYALKDHIRIYPNPASNKVFVRSPVAVSLSLFDLNGKKLKEADKAELELGGIAEGLYFLRIYDRQGNPIKIEKLSIHNPN